MAQRDECYLCGGHLENDGRNYEDSHVNRADCIRNLQGRISDLRYDKDTAIEERDAALRRAEEADAIANSLMTEGLRARIENADLRSPRERDEWHEGDGPVLWWKLPVCEPPYAGTPLDDGFPDYVTHWTPIVVPFGADGNGGSDA